MRVKTLDRLNADNAFVFSSGKGLMRVSADGGVPEPLTTLDAAKGETAHVRPQFLPGGRQLLFTVMSPAGPQFAVRDLDTPGYRVVASGGYNGQYVSTGHLTFLRGTTVFAVPFDVARLTVAGGEVPVVENVSALGPTGELAPCASFWSATERAALAAQAPFGGDLAMAADALQILIDDAVALRITADVPVGAFLSGGIDSSTVAAAMQHVSPGSVRTFTVGFPDADYDETPHAGSVARHLGTDHTTFEVSDAEREVVRSARSVYDYDDRFISPRYGFRGADDYYGLCAPMHFMPEIRVPTMVLAACDDPWIPIDHYRGLKWSDNPWLLPVMPETGGHVGFHGDASGRPWCNLAIEKFLDRVTND